MNLQPIEQAKNPLLARTLPALLRARKRAEELAAATNTAIIDLVGVRSCTCGRHRQGLPAPENRGGGLAEGATPPAPRSAP
jgi:hypothetical protein